MNRSPRRGAALALIAAALTASGASAQSIRRPTVVTPRAPLATQAAPAVAAPAGPTHQVFGTIVTLTKTEFGLRTRAGRTIVVNAADAISSGRYSAPLFVGKVVVVTGTSDAHGVLYAQVVTRMTRIDDSNLRDR